MALDLDPEPLEYGRTHYLPALNAEQSQRLKVLRKNVISVTPTSDLIAAGNFSFCIFKDRATLVRYFRHCLRSLKKGSGVLVLDVAGGQNMLEKSLDRRTIRAPGIGRYAYEWECFGFDPISHSVRYAIHFKLPNGKRFNNAFTYDWRHWSIPEIRDAMMEAGFKSTKVFWDVSQDPDHEKHDLREKAEDMDCYIAYVAGLA
jgi:hypothetical protein